MSEEMKKGDPTALGMFAYGFSLFILSLYAVGFFAWGQSILMIAPALVFGGLFLLVAAGWEYNNGNTFGATAFGTYSAFFLTFAVAHIGLELNWAGFTGVSVAHLVGLLALSFVIMTFIYMIGALKMTWAHVMVLFWLLIVFILYAVPLLSLNAAGTSTLLGTWTGTGVNPSLVPAGIVGIIDALLTFWVGGAVIINDRWEKAGFRGPVPLFPIGKPKAKKAALPPLSGHK